MAERSRRRVTLPRTRYSPEPVTTRKSKKAADVPPESPSSLIVQKRVRNKKPAKDEVEDLGDNNEAIAESKSEDLSPATVKPKRRGRPAKRHSMQVEPVETLDIQMEPTFEPRQPDPEIVTIIRPTIIDEPEAEKSPAPLQNEEEATIIIIRPTTKEKEKSLPQKPAKRIQKFSSDAAPMAKEARLSDRVRKPVEEPKKPEFKEQNKSVQLGRKSSINGQALQPTKSTTESAADSVTPVDSAPRSIPLKPKRPMPQRMAPCSVGLFDSIFESQTALMKERNKTEQEKAEELKQLELSKREKARGALGYYDASLPQQILKPRLSISNSLMNAKPSISSLAAPKTVPSATSVASSDSLPTLSKKSRESPDITSPIRTPSPAGSPTPPDIVDGEEVFQEKRRSVLLKKEGPLETSAQIRPTNFTSSLINRPPLTIISSKSTNLRLPHSTSPMTATSALPLQPLDTTSPHDQSLTPSTSTSTPSQSSPSEAKKKRKSRLFRAADDPILTIPRKTPTPGASVNAEVNAPAMVPYSLPSFTTPPPLLVSNSSAQFAMAMDFSFPPPIIGQFALPPPDFSAPPPDFSAPPPFIISNLPPPPQQEDAPIVAMSEMSSKPGPIVDLSSIPLPPLPPPPEKTVNSPPVADEISNPPTVVTTATPIQEEAMAMELEAAQELGEPILIEDTEKIPTMPQLEPSERLLQLDELVLGLPDEEAVDERKQLLLEPTPISDSDEDDDSEVHGEDSDSEISTDSDGEVEHNGVTRSNKNHVEKVAENGASSAIEVGDARELLRRADAVLQGLSSNRSMYEQVELSAEALAEKLKEVEEPKTQPEFYGEPVPDDDDGDDALFEIAAGLPRKRKEEEGGEEEKPPSNEIIELDFYNADMHIKAHPTNNWLIDPDNGDGFALMWGSVRSNFGFVLPEEGTDVPKIVYQVKIAEFMSLKHVPFEENEPHDLRLGWSAETVHTTPGEMTHSYAICRLARKAADNQFSDFGSRIFGINDVITIVLDLNRHTIEVCVNDEELGIAFNDINFGSPGTVIHPHIGVKNVKIFVNFGVQAPELDAEWSLPSCLATLKRSELQFVGQLDQSKMIPARRAPSSKADCTVLMMVGLPAAGKSHWVREYLHEHPDENWIILNTDLMLSRMTVNGVPRRRVHQGRWDMVMGLTAKALSRACQLACRRRHNYILDQTNVSRDARKRKLTLFTDFERKCVVLVPSSDEYETRQLRQARAEPTNQIPPEALLELKALFALPEVGVDPVEEVIFIEPPQERLGDAVELVRRYNEDGKPYLRQRRFQYGRPREPVISDSRSFNNNF